jgi:outer membrane protein
VAECVFFISGGKRGEIVRAFQHRRQRLHRWDIKRIRMVMNIAAFKRRANLAPENPIFVRFSLGLKSRMKAGLALPDASNANGIGQAPVQHMKHMIHRNGVAQIEDGHLRQGMNAGIGAARPSHVNRGAFQLTQHRFQLALNRCQAGLHLPAAKGGAIVGHRNLNPARGPLLASLLARVQAATIPLKLPLNFRVKPPSFMTQPRSLLSCVCALLALQPVVMQAQPTVRVTAPPRVGLNQRGYLNWFSSNYRPSEIAPINLANSGRLESLLRGGNLYLSMQDALALAVENNLDVELQRYGPEQAKASLLRAQAGGLLRGQTIGVAAGPTSVNQNAIGGFTGAAGGGGGGGNAGGNAGGTVISATGTALPNLDPVFQSSINLGHRTAPQANTVTTGVTAITVNSHTINNAIQMGWLTGTTANFAWQLQSNLNNNPQNDLNVSRSGSFSASVTQRLLQGFGRPVNNRNIRIANNNVRVSDLQFQLQLITTVAAVQNLYWDLVSYRADAQVKQQALDLARKLYQDNQKQVEIGTLAPIEVVSAEAAMAAREQDLVNAETVLLQQETVIKNALSRTGVQSPSLAEARVIPTDQIRIPDTDPIRPMADLYTDAVRLRPEIQQTQINLDNSRIGLAGSKSQLLPSLDVTASAANNGLAGAVNTLPFPSNVTPRPRNPDPYFIGGYGTVLGQLFRRNFPDYSIQMQLNVPIRNRSAQADMIVDSLNIRQAELTAQRQLNQLRVDLQNAAIAVRQARARYDSAVKQRQLQEQTLDAEQKKYTLGASTAFFVIQYQNQLAQSQSSEVAARAAYAKARVELSRVTGSTLTENNIEIAEAVVGRLSRAPDAIPAQ